MLLISPNFYVQSIIFPQFLPGALSQNWLKSPDMFESVATDLQAHVVVGAESGISVTLASDLQLCPYAHTQPQRF